jgi:hypothetical protein
VYILFAQPCFVNFFVWKGKTVRISQSKTIELVMWKVEISSCYSCKYVLKVERNESSKNDRVCDWLTLARRDNSAIQNNSFEISFRQNRNKTDTSFIATFSTVLPRFVSSQLTFPSFHFPGSAAALLAQQCRKTTNGTREAIAETCSITPSYVVP